MGIFQEIASKGYEVKFSETDENEFRICCPFCIDRGTTPDTKFRCGINIQSGQGHCFNCNWGSQEQALLILVRKLELSTDSIESVRDISFTGKTRVRKEPVVLPDGFTPLVDLKKDDLEYGPAVRYCLKRGITRDQMRRHDIGATLEDKDYSYRIIFPCRDKTGLLRGYVGRSWLADAFLKYKNSTGTKSLWNGRIDLYPGKYIIVSEGVIKALAIERAIGNKFCSAASCGSSITNGQMDMLFGFKELILFPDPDDVGKDAYVRCAMRMRSVLPKVSLAWPPPTRQADELTPEQIRKHLRERKTVDTRFRFEQQLEGMMI